MKKLFIITLLALSNSVFAETPCDAAVESLTKKLDEDGFIFPKPEPDTDKEIAANSIKVIVTSDHEILEPTAAIRRIGEYKRVYSYTYIKRSLDAEQPSECFPLSLVVTFLPINKYENSAEKRVFTGKQCLELRNKYRGSKELAILADDELRQFGRACDQMFLNSPSKK